MRCRSTADCGRYVGNSRRAGPEGRGNLVGNAVWASFSSTPKIVPIFVLVGNDGGCERGRESGCDRGDG